MAETKVIPTQTTLNVIGSIITINTRYISPNIGSIISCFISEVFGGEVVGGIPFIEGEGGVQFNTNYIGVLGVSLSDDGELIVNGNDANQYSIDSETGQLTYTY